MWDWLTGWWASITPAKGAPAKALASPKLLAVQAAMLTGAFAMGGASMQALQRSTDDAQAALNQTSGEAGAIDAMRTIGMANIAARDTLRAESHPDQPIEHRATYAILEHSAAKDQTAEIQAKFARQRREVLQALYRTYHHERLQLEALQPQDEAQRALIQQRLSELPEDPEAELAKLLDEDEAQQDEVEPLAEAEPEPEAPVSGLSQALGFASATAQPDTVAATTAAVPDTVSARPTELLAELTVPESETASKPTLVDMPLGQE